MSHNLHSLRIVYFSMEIALANDIPTYSGGLGILAGDTLRSAADAGLPMAGVTLLYRKGHFDQQFDAQGNQTASPTSWNPEAVLEPLDVRATVTIEGRKVALRAWQYSIAGLGGGIVPVILLDTALPENSPADQALTQRLYVGDDRYRLCQEAVLGIGGMEILRALGAKRVLNYHMNEGHASLLTISLLESQLRGRPSKEITEEDLESIKRRCVFTTHTPVPAGHDHFPRDMVLSVLGEKRTELLDKLGCLTDGVLNMTYLGLRCSHYINGVAMNHAEITRGMFAGYTIHAITNGVHATTWTSPPFQELFDKHFAEWRRDNNYLRYA
ncbi:MAG TPA: alpha-glucan family phosphorylase, partial [Candidatus Acidoferrales bacterium]|nr:alpha-glucan family phosphorylase [Candidatus Acidoferrales bacterium]